jgi:hypothetical protein
VVLDLHTESARTNRNLAPDPAHAKDPEYLVLWVVAELEVRAAPLSCAHGGVWVVDAPERAEEEEEGGVGGSIVYCDGCAGDVDACVELGAL